MEAENFDSLWTAWRVWLSGEELTRDTLWGIPVLGLGRLGKVIEFVSAALILCELAGPLRLESFSASLRRAFRPADTGRLLWLSLRHTGLRLYWFFSKHGTPESHRAEQQARGVISSGYRRRRMITSGLLVGVTVAWRLSYGDLHPPLGALAWVFTLVIVPIMLGCLWVLYDCLVTPFVLTAVLLLVWTIAAMFWTVSTALAWTLRRQRAGATLKIASFLLFATGFHFDLLAS